MWTNLSIGAFRFRRVQIEEHRTGGGKMWTNLCFAAFRGALGVRVATSFPGRPPPRIDINCSPNLLARASRGCKCCFRTSSSAWEDSFS